jgi:hypothetical protein
LLGPNPEAPVRVYAVWYNMFPGDSRQRWRPDLLSDSRVTHYWDEPRAIGRAYFQDLTRMWEKRAPDTVPPLDLILWDAYLLYGAEARWNEEPPDVVSWGSTILMVRDRLKEDLTATLKR